MVFDAKYDPSHKARLVAGITWTVNVKEHNFSGISRMDTKNWIFLRRKVLTFMLHM
jgi:hypothetical protein